MVPAHDTVDAIISTVKALNKGKKWEYKREFRSLPNILSIWLPITLFILGASLAFINRWVQSPWLSVVALCLLLLMYVSITVGTVIDLLTLWPSMRDLLGTIVETSRMFANADAPHVNELFKYQQQDLQYVLVELKAERGAWERRVGVLIGAQEKIGMIPGLIALIAALSRLQGDPLPSWVVGVVYALPVLYFFGLCSHILMTKLDRGIMLLEMVIDTLKNKGSDETTKRQEIEVEIALPQENINSIDLEQLQTAINNLMEICEFKLKEELDPIRGSWWRKLIFWSKDKTTPTAVNRIFQTVKEVFVARSIGIPSAEETIKLTEAVDRVIKSLEPFESGIIRLGKLLVIKGTRENKPILRVETISLSLAQKLAENPQLIKMPQSLLLLIEEEEIANQAVSHLAASDKPQGYLSTGPLAQLPPSKELC